METILIDHYIGLGTELDTLNPFKFHYFYFKDEKPEKQKCYQTFYMSGTSTLYPIFLFKILDFF